MTTLRLMIPSEWDANEDSCEWVILDRHGQVIRRGKDRLGAFPQCDEIEIVVPAAMVGFMAARLPSGNRSKVLNALPFLVEAGLISSPEDTHVVLAAQTDAQVVVAVIQKFWVKRLLARLARTDIFPVRMFPETLLPGMPHEGWSMVCRGQDSFIRSSAVQGFPLDIDSGSDKPPFMLMLALNQAQVRPFTIVVYGQFPKHAADWAAELGVQFASATRQEWFVNDSKPVLNLLQGEFQASGGIIRKLVVFKPVAMALAALLVMQIVFSVLDYALKASENRKLDQEMVTQFKATFPNAMTIVDAPLQMQRNLNDLKHGAGESGNADFIPLLSAVTASLGVFPSETLKSMAYQNGKLILSLFMPDMVQAQAMQQRLLTSGLFAAIESAQPSAQGIELQLVISTGAS